MVIYMKSKKAQGLSMNTIIIAILVLIVLVVLIAFFTSGFSSTSGGIADLLKIKTAGVSQQIAENDCRAWCETGNEVAYCGHDFHIDSDGDGNADRDPKTKELNEFKCADTAINIKCASITCA
jgi:hypothetical protein